jgi:N-acetylglucosaminyldiphosphoundecaprenol N-acetyl-beta-D-mannosaminyltransferase
MRTDLLGCSVDVLTMAETVDLARAAMRDRCRLQHVALNVAKFVNMRSDRVLHSDVMASDVIGIDGMGIVLALRMFGIPVKERVAVLNRAAAAINAHFPSVQIAGLRDGYFRSDQEHQVVEQIIASKADCLFIAMPTPRKERFLSAHRDRLGVPFIMGIGGSLDVIAGHVRRAPQVMQSMGLEWLYRVYQEPRRMWWRYAKTNIVFAGILIRGLVDQNRVGGRRLSRFG